MEKRKETNLLVWMDEKEKSRLRLIAAFEGVSMAEMVRRMIAQAPVVGKIDGGKVVFNREG